MEDFVVSIQYQALSEKVREAFYNNADGDVSNTITSKVRQHISRLLSGLESTNEFEFQEDLARGIKQMLRNELSEKGYKVVEVAVNKVVGQQSLRPDMEMAYPIQQQMVRTTPQSTAESLIIVPENCEDCCCWQHVGEQQVGVVEDLGQFSRVLDEPGWHCICWPVLEIVGRLSLLPQQLNNIVCDSRTVDHAVVRVVMSVQYHVRKDAAYEAYYRCVSPDERIRQYIQAKVRSRFPSMTENQVMNCGEDLAKALLDGLSKEMEDVGFEVSNVAIMDLTTVQSSTQLPCSENPDYKPPVQLSLADELLHGQFEPSSTW